MATTEAEAKATEEETEKKKPGRPKKEPPPPKQREVRASKADEKVQAVIDLVKGSKEPLTYDEIIEKMEWPKHSYDIVHFSMTALALVGLVNKVGTWEGTGRARVAFEWAGKSVK